VLNTASFGQNLTSCRKQPLQTQTMRAPIPPRNHQAGGIEQSSVAPLTNNISRQRHQHAPRLSGRAHTQLPKTNRHVPPQRNTDRQRTRRVPIKDGGVILGSNKDCGIKSIPVIERPARIFVTRVDPEVEPKSLHKLILDKASIDCQVFKLKSKHDSYASYVFEVPKFYESCLLAPDLWPDGVLVKRFKGKPLDENATEIVYSDEPVAATS
jgi:hypothetical protein